MDVFATWDTVCARMQEFGVTAASLCEIKGGTVQRAICGVVSGALASGAAQDTLVRLQDPSGSVACCLHGDVVEEFPFVTCPGAGVILRNVTVMHSRDGPCVLACRHNVVSLFEQAPATALHGQQAVPSVSQPAPYIPEPYVPQNPDFDDDIEL
jgi:hypothetical protein